MLSWVQELLLWKMVISSISVPCRLLMRWQFTAYELVALLQFYNAQVYMLTRFDAKLYFLNCFPLFH